MGVVGGSNGLIADNFKFILNAFICKGKHMYCFVLTSGVRYDIFSD